jgi:tetratricopeptide (TPR) repeat protein
MAQGVEAPKVNEPSEPPRPRARSSVLRANETLGRLADVGLIVAFLSLVFLLGAFPLKDTDFWWHLRTGDLIRQTGKVPTVDTYTFGADGHTWVDLHWIFQVLISHGFERFGVPGINLAKCAITCVAVALLITARRRDWPVWTMVLAWLPALLVLAGRMYIRPETLTLLYLSMYLAILFRIDESPRLAFALPLVQVAWVNSQGLFVFGPIVLVLALIGAALRRGAFEANRLRWWKTVLIASVLTGLACLLNPYGLKGALYPFQLLGTMSNPIFADHIAELQSIPEFIKKAGFWNVMLQTHLFTAALGILSFLIPICWRVWDRTSRPKPLDPEVDRKKAKKARRKGQAAVKDESIQPSLFRLMLFVLFTALSLKATRNSHQFAAVAGVITAWNFGEWAAEVARRRADLGQSARGRSGRVVAFVATAALFIFTATGGLYALEGEGRTVGIGEEPHWFPHEAIAFAGRPDMPTRSLCYHDGHAALYEYKYAPEHKTYADARLEVMGPELYTRYTELGQKISQNKSGWEAELDSMGKPLVLVDNVHALQSSMTATLLTSPHYRCVWFDAVASIFVHDSYTGAVQAHGFRFGDWHFRRQSRPSPTDAKAELMMAKTCWNLCHNLIPQGMVTRTGWKKLSREIVWAGLDHARAVQRLNPESADGWKWAGMLENYRDWTPEEKPDQRFRKEFDPVFDLSPVRATADLKRALERSPADGNALVSLATIDYLRGMYADSLALFDRYLARGSAQSSERSTQQLTELKRLELIRLLGDPPGALEWANLNELNSLLNELYTHGRPAEAAEVLERAYPADARPWEISDRLATIYLHLGEPDRAIRTWTAARNPPNEAVRNARIAAARLASGDFAGARSSYDAAIKLNPNLFESLFGLAMLETDEGNAPAALDAFRAALKVAPHPAAGSKVMQMIEALEGYAKP